MILALVPGPPTAEVSICPNPVYQEFNHICHQDPPPPVQYGFLLLPFPQISDVIL